MKRVITYSLAKSRDCFDNDGRKITGFTITTTDGKDENYAAKRADAAGTNLTEELIRVSLLSYTRAAPTALATVDEDGKVVPAPDETIQIKQPYVAFDQWSTKARNFVVAAYKKVTIPDEEEFADFFASASEA